MNEEFVTCALCGHQIPAHLVRGRDSVSCACGMRIQAPAAVTPRTSPVALMLLAAAILLLTAVAALARRLTG